MTLVLAQEAIELGGRIVLRDIRLTLPPGQLVALCGPNGAGKTTLLRAFAGLLPGLPRPDPRTLVYVPQGARSAWGLTIEQVAALGRIPHRDADPEAVERALRDCGVWELRDARVDRVSGGQARRAMLARALATRAAHLLLDEPVSDLDPAAQHEIMRLLRRLADGGALVAVVLHALELAGLYADRVIVIDRGRIVSDAAPARSLPVAARVFGLPWGRDESPRLLPPPP